MLHHLYTKHSHNNVTFYSKTISFTGQPFKTFETFAVTPTVTEPAHFYAEWMDKNAHGRFKLLSHILTITGQELSKSKYVAQLQMQVLKSYYH